MLHLESPACRNHSQLVPEALGWANAAKKSTKGLSQNGYGSDEKKVRWEGVITAINLVLQTVLTIHPTDPPPNHPEQIT
jgi:hypothetical protein